MASPLNALKDAIATVWEATAPPDRPTIRYRRSKTRTPPDGTTADRAFWFEPSQRIGIDSEADGVTYVRWGVVVILGLSGAGRSIDEIEDASVNEQNLLLRRIEMQGDAWRPAGCHTVLTSGPEVEVDDETGDYRITFFFTALVAETDGS